ncbi:MAG TPA: hypothetical protein VNG33_03270 [Polyangiaceae bacterium]|nr:hypothetical protein [Polyangiaceae bacterium]
MTEETNETGSPAGETGPLTESAAAALLQDWHDEPEEQAPKVDSARVRANEAEDAVERTEAELSDSSSEEEGDPDAETVDEDSFVHGNAKTRLRDGTAVTVGELKKLADEAKEFKRRESEFTAQRQQIEARAAQNAQQEQLFANTITQAIAALQHALPPEPDPALRESDPIEYFLRKDQREAKLAELNRLDAARNYAAHQARAEQAQNFQARLKTEQSQLYERAPDLADEGKRREFYNNMISTGKAYGFSEDEMNNVHDHRVMLLVKDAIAYRKLQDGKPKAMEKAKSAKVPVSTPAARASSNERIATKHKNLFDRARKTRSVDDVGALLAELE